MKIFRKMMPLAIAAGATIALIGMNSFAAGTADISNPVGGGSMEANPVVITFPTTENYLDIGCISRGYYKLKTAGDKKATIVITGINENNDVSRLVSMTDKTTPIQTSIEIAPGEEFSFYSKSDTSVRVNFAVVYEGETLKEVAASKDETKPMDITAGTSVEVPEVTGISYFYYKLHLDSYCRVSAAEDSTYKSFYARPIAETDTITLYTDLKVDGEKDVKYYAPGDYLVRLDASSGKTAPKFGIKATPINFGTVKCDVPESFECGKEASFDVELVGADDDIKISSVAVYSGDKVISDNNGDITAVKKGTAKLVLKSFPKDSVLKINVTGPMKGVVTVFEKAVKVQDAAIDYSITSGYDSITVKTFNVPSGLNKAKMTLQVKKGGKWKNHQTVAAQTTMTFKKFKQGTKYTVRFIKTTDGVESAPSKETTLMTGYKNVPVASITMKKVGKHTVKAHWTNGYWSGNTWIRSKYIPKKTYNDYEVTVKLKKKLKGIQGIYINNLFTKGNGLTFKRKGIAIENTIKKYDVKVRSCMSETYQGCSKEYKKTVAIR